MTDKTFTDEEVVKALEHCSSSCGSDACNGCPFDETEACYDRENIIAVEALAVINHQKAEIERLRQAYANYEETTGLKQAKTEVAKAIFAEIEQSLYMHFRFCKEESGNVDPKYLEGRLALNTQMQDLIAELKKKYE